jgi:uncharacterized protein YbaP (TraB family)
MKLKIITKRIIISVTLFVLFASAAAAQPKSLLWKIESPNTQPSYLFGTIHLLPASRFELPSQISDLVKQSDQLILELDMDDPGLQIEMMQHIEMKQDQTIKDMMGEASYSKLDSLLESTYGTGMKAFDRWKPLMVASMLYSPMMEEPLASFEISLVKLALNANKDIEGLETAKEQLEIFDAVPYDQQVQDLEEMILSLDDKKNQFDEVLNLYSKRDIDQLSIFTKNEFDNDLLYRLMITERNKKWINRIKEKTSSKSSFIAVGAGHLGGNQGLVRLLQSAGFEMTPILSQ